MARQNFLREFFIRSLTIQLLCRTFLEGGVFKYKAINVIELISSYSKTAVAVFSILLLSTTAVSANECDTSAQGLTSVDCGATPSATFDQNGRLWLTYVQDQHVYVSHSDDFGESYSPSVVVNKIPEDAEHNGENRPKIIVDADSNIFVSWTKKTSPRFTGEIRFSRSTDGGHTFETPRTINDD